MWSGGRFGRLISRESSAAESGRRSTGVRKLERAIRSPYVVFRTAFFFREFSSFGRQQRLYFSPLPQGHGAPRWVVARRRRRPPKCLVKTSRAI